MVKLSASDVLFYEQNFMTLFDQASNSLEFAKAMNGKKSRKTENLMKKVIRL